ncbi:MAG: VWA domain-containing protein [Desulfobacteraceae bacterium]|nr:VWA domain-containing protein [Desulfobacteraceae bacterium]
MTLINPTALWLLSLIPVVVLIHSLKPKPRQLDVSSLFLLEEALSAKGGGLNLRKIVVNNLPLLLQILIILAATAGLADPVWEFQEKTTSDMVVVIDTSASMKARTEAGTRFDQARAAALALTDTLADGHRMLIIEAGRKAVIKSVFTADNGKIRETLNSLTATDVTGDFEKAVFLALSFLDMEKRDTLHLITDGTREPMERIRGLYPYMSVTQVSEKSDNVGITRFEFRSELMAEDQYQIFLSIQNFNPVAVDFPVRITIDNTVVATFPYHLEPGEEKRFVFPYRGLIAGAAKVAIDRPDDLEADNNAYAVLSRSPDIWVLLASGGNYFIEQILAAYPNVKINRIDRIVPSSWEQQVRSNDIVIIDRMDFPPVATGNFLLINAFSRDIPIRRTGTVRHSVVTDWDRRHPVTQQVDLDAIAIRDAALIQGHDDVRPLVMSAQTGLIHSYQTDNLKAVFIGFDPSNSDLPYRVAFPVLMSNVINWLYPDKLNRSSSQVKSGHTIKIPLDTRVREVRVRNPAGKWTRHAVATTPFLFQGTTDVGLYTILAGKKRRYFAVNLLSPHESDINAAHIETNTEAVEGAEAEPVATVRKSFWFYLIFGAAIILLGEWVAWLKFGK